MDLHQGQRAMRAMRRQALQRGVIALLDIGTSKISCLILKLEPSETVREGSGVGALAGQVGFRVIGWRTIQSRGVRFGEIVSMKEAERALRCALQDAQKMAQTRVDHAIVCFAGGDFQSYGLVGRVEVQGDVVTENDVARVLDACQMPDLGRDREVLHAQPVNFTLDQRTGLSDPRGMSGEALEVDMNLISVDRAVMQNIVQCLKSCDVEVAGLAAAPYVAGLSALVEDEQELGSALIDLGGGATGVSIFMKKHMLFSGTVRMGIDHVTSDIAKAFQIPYSTAERIKNFSGGVHATGKDDRELIAVGGDSGDWDKDQRTITRSELIGIMRPRVDEILEEVRAMLDRVYFDSLPSHQIVLTGGGSHIPGIDGLASRILGHQVRVGRPLRVRGLPEASAGAPFSAIVGLCQFATRPQDEWWDFAPPSDRFANRSIRRVADWFVRNW